MRSTSPLRASITRLEPAWSAGDLQLPLGAGAVQQHQTLDPALLAEALHHFGDQRPVVLDHLVFERDADQVALGQRGRPRRLQEGSHVVLGIEVSAARTRQHNGCGDANRKTCGRAGEGRLCAAGHRLARIMSQSARSVNG